MRDLVTDLTMQENITNNRWRHERDMFIEQRRNADSLQYPVASKTYDERQMRPIPTGALCDIEC